MTTDIRRWLRPGSAPTVVFCNGMAMPYEMWMPTVELLPPDQSLVLFDRPHRPGHPGDDLELVADEIDEAVGDATAPLLIVGHSFGGLLAEAYARVRPERVCGLVLLDASIPADYDSGGTPYDAEVLPNWRKWLGYLPTLPFADPLMGKAIAASVVAGATRHDDFRDVYANLPTDAVIQLGSKATIARALYDDHSIGALSHSLLAARSGPLQLPIPVLLASSGPRVLPLAQRTWVERHRAESADLGTDISLAVADGAHMLMLDRPSEVADAILDVMARGDCGRDDASESAGVDVRDEDPPSAERE